MSINILGISELKWTAMGKFNLDDHYIYYCGQEMGVALRVSKRVQNAVHGCNLKNDRMISVRFQGKPFDITVIQICASTSNAEEAEVERFNEPLFIVQESSRPSGTNTQECCPFCYRGLECKSWKSRDTWSNGHIQSWSTK